MSEAGNRPDAAVALIEFSSIAVGMVAGDAMVKASPVGSIYAGTVHPGKYLVLVSGDTASVDEAFSVGREIGDATIVDSVFLPDIHPAVANAIVSDADDAPLEAEALGIVETATVATVIEAADAGVKAAHVHLPTVQIADGLGGRAYVLFCGVVGEVEAAVEAAVARVEFTGNVLHHRIIPQVHEAMVRNLGSDLKFLRRVALRSTDRSS